MKSSFVRKRSVFLIIDVFVTEQLTPSDLGRRKTSLFCSRERCTCENPLYRWTARGACQLPNRFARNHRFPLAGPSGEAPCARRSCLRKHDMGPRGPARRTRAQRRFRSCCYRKTRNGPRRKNSAPRKFGRSSCKGRWYGPEKEFLRLFVLRNSHAFFPMYPPFSCSARRGDFFFAAVVFPS